MCSRPLSQNNRLVFLWCFWLPQLCSLYASGPHFPLSVGPWDWLITSFVPEGKRGMSTWLILSVWGLSDEGAFSIFLSLSLPGRTSGPLHTHLVFNSDKWVHFLKSIRSVIRKVRCEGFFLLQENSCMQSDGVLSWTFLLFFFFCTNGINCAWHSRVVLSIFWVWWLVFVPDLSDDDCTSSVSIVAGNKTWDVVACCL